MSMHSRKYLRIEGDLATLVTEVTEREVALDDLLSRLAEQRSAISGVLPAGCRFWVRSPEGREVFVVEQLPMRRQIEYHASNRYGSEPVTHRLALPYVVFVVSTAGGRIESLSHFFRTSALRSLDDPLEHSCLPNTSDDGIVCLGYGARGRRQPGRADRRADHRVLVEPLQRRHPAPSAAVQRWLPGVGVALAAGPDGGPVGPIRPLLAQPAPGGGVVGRHGPRRPAGRTGRRPRPGTVETPAPDQAPPAEGGDSHAAAA